MAKVYRQSGEYKAEFSKRIQEKQVMQEHRVRQRVEDAVPQWAGWLLKPLATGMVRARQHRATQRGAGGEFSVGVHMWARLPKEWTVINDVVLEYQPGDYTQLDHVAIGPSGIFLIETKAWTSAVLLKNDRCFRKEAGRWGCPPQAPLLSRNRIFAASVNGIVGTACPTPCHPSRLSWCSRTLHGLEPTDVLSRFVPPPKRSLICAVPRGDRWVQRKLSVLCTRFSRQRLSLQNRLPRGVVRCLPQRMRCRLWRAPRERAGGTFAFAVRERIPNKSGSAMGSREG